MKKAYLLFTVIFSLCTLHVFARTISINCTKNPVPFGADTTKTRLKLTETDSIKQKLSAIAADTLFQKLRIVSTDTISKQALIVANTAKPTLITAQNNDSLKQWGGATAIADSLQTTPAMLPADMNVPLLIAGSTLKHPVTDKPADMNLGGAIILFTPLTENELIATQDNLPTEINVPLLVAGNSILKHPGTDKPVDMNLGGTVVLFMPVNDNDLQLSVIKEIEANLNHVQGQFAAVAFDTLKAAIPQKMPQTINTLKQQISLISNDSLRAVYYQKIADHYLSYDSISIRKTKLIYQDAALEFTLKALHSYTRAVDGYGIMKSYINLSKVYFDQKKYSQAKWFILQANTRARNFFDVPYTISTLVSLANIKIPIKDYSLAKRDLDEALMLSAQNHLSKQEALVQQTFGVLYVYLNQPQKAKAAFKRHDVLEDSILKAADAKRLAAVATQDSVQQTKKKADISTGKKTIKTNSYKRIASI